MRISPQKLLVTAAFGFVVGCAPATGGGDGGTCTLDTDCPDLQQCHPELGVCEDECTADTDCGGDRPVCNVQGGDGGPYILEVDGIRDLCICDENSCAEGEFCSQETGLCEAGEGDAGPTPDECTEDADCGGDEVCANGQCEAACADADCIPDGELCSLDPTDPEYNQCVPADLETAFCAEADGAPAQGGAETIVVYFAETLTEDAAGCDVAGSTYLRSYWFDVYSTADLTADPAQDLVFRPGFTAGNEKFFQDTAVDVETTITDLGDGDYGVVVWICGGASSPESAALQIRTDDSDSNTYCFDPLVDPVE